MKVIGTRMAIQQPGKPSKTPTPLWFSSTSNLAGVGFVLVFASGDLIYDLNA